MEKKLYQKPCFISKTGKAVNIVPAVAAAAAGSVAAAAVTSAVKAMLEPDDDYSRHISYAGLKPVLVVSN